MPAVTIADHQVEVPASVVDRSSFLHWAESDEFPERGRYAWLAGKLWVDNDMEQIFWHNALKLEIAAGLLSLVRAGGLGYFFADGVFVNNDAADVANQPDGVFVSADSVRSGRVRFVPGARGGATRLDGSPDMVLEVVSDSSVRKDTQQLRTLYWQAGVAEYWLVDARRGRLSFEILRRGTTGFEAVPTDAAGRVRSELFARSFALTASTDPLGQPSFRLTADA